jgi:DNA polymerase IV
MYVVDDLSVIRETAKNLLASTPLDGKKIRLLGISISNFGDAVIIPKKQDENGQLRLFQ